MSRTKRNFPIVRPFRKPKNFKHNKNVFVCRDLEEEGFKPRARDLRFKPTSYDDLSVAALSEFKFIWKK